LIRDITRKKFVQFATEEMFMDKKYEMEYEEKLYRQMVEFHKVSLLVLEESLITKSLFG